jgi:hypothetical protein
MGEMGRPVETLQFGLSVYFLIRQQVTTVATRPLSFHQPAIELNRKFAFHAGESLAGAGGEAPRPGTL